MSSSKPLTDMACRNAKHNPEGKGNKLFDGGGLFLELMPSGSKKWRLKFRFNGRENRMSFGDYPTVSLSDARERREAAKKLLASGADPAHQRDDARRREAELYEARFSIVADEWIDARRARWSEGHTERIRKLLESDVYPDLGKRPISEIRASELLAVVRKIEKRGALEIAKKTLQICGQVFRYAVATDRAERDLSVDLRDALTSRPATPMARIDESALPELLRKIDAYQGEPETRLALRFLNLTFVRTIELRHAEWPEIDIERAEWRIPAEKMKKRRPHIVPLSRQALAVLEEIRPLTGAGRWVFTSPVRRNQPLSENFVLSALGRMGFRHTMTGHGFRGLASTILNEREFNSDWIERQLAHVEGNGVRAAYNHAQYLPQRRKMMQWWADYLDDQRRPNVLQFAPRR
ncbi:integrase arm-type DNA-binding domain-containing protein [Paraburkholderia madseniana]|uniref:Integrase arm-type DNA-binding domain-containing protein n=1 Tax=Paraburkholderia madseniana TaxID=2599607 RepID=A0AAP5BHK3_9BURK|nr:MULTISPECIES: integrase arm-type DNA-binding domain-containing protein [Paraburkholderia]MCX4148461.1 integrase arm-type DNA-binding domain-containing protein [Paraburkholderia madseniana]MDN7151399.1 integrase arm-type DNA-binding domain-containing protein [Paraburkholderia sp. WS6]MDQ6410279.1 integrase arm-type DNA-binding domain-containing protein [Paraburkholderia madseniana]